MVHRFALVLLVATLSFSMCGLSSMFAPEGCTAGERSGTDQTCPPSCVTCGCCHRSVDVSGIAGIAAQFRIVTESPAPSEQPRFAAPRKILHVPKLVPA